MQLMTLSLLTQLGLFYDLSSTCEADHKHGNTVTKRNCNHDNHSGPQVCNKEKLSCSELKLIPLSELALLGFSCCPPTTCEEEHEHGGTVTKTKNASIVSYTDRAVSQHIACCHARSSPALQQLLMYCPDSDVSVADSCPSAQVCSLSFDGLLLSPVIPALPRLLLHLRSPTLSFLLLAALRYAVQLLFLLCSQPMGDNTGLSSLYDGSIHQCLEDWQQQKHESEDCHMD